MVNGTKAELCKVIERLEKEIESVHDLLDEYQITRVNLTARSHELTLFGRVYAAMTLLEVVKSRRSEHA